LITWHVWFGWPVPLGFEAAYTPPTGSDKAASPKAIKSFRIIDSTLQVCSASG
jgi:hypothetical protein